MEPWSDSKVTAGLEVTSSMNACQEVVTRLLDQQVGAIFQGKAEMGARALGNRSIIFDPRVPNGKDIVNRVKQREWYRPFAATVLEEHARDWFVMGKLTSSPWMLYALPTLPERIAQIPAVVHVDGTCRAQTVTRAQNPKWYDLIFAFSERTGVPLLLNTSFNLAGEPLVHTRRDALDTLERSALNFIYFADGEEIVCK
jgi:carbamoyltransferase